MTSKEKKSISQVVLDIADQIQEEREKDREVFMGQVLSGGYPVIMGSTGRRVPKYAGCE